jgi:hypothetical protein
MHNLYFLELSQTQLKKNIITEINRAEKTNDQIALKLFDGSTKPKIFNSEMVVDLKLNKGINIVRM